MRSKTVVSVLLALVTLTAQAEERKQICAKPPNARAAYSVEGILTEGAELNLKTQSFRYQQFARYVVIFWKDHEATVLLMDGMGIVNVYPIEGTDQEGRRWSVALNTGICYL